MELAIMKSWNGNLDVFFFQKNNFWSGSLTSTKIFPLSLLLKLILLEYFGKKKLVISSLKILALVRCTLA